jgi:hypothetical protein
VEPLPAGCTPGRRLKIGPRADDGAGAGAYVGDHEQRTGDQALATRHKRTGDQAQRADDHAKELEMILFAFLIKPLIRAWRRRRAARVAI